MFSYDRLGDPKFQNCFLYCSSYPEDYEIERMELIEKWIDEGLLDELETRQALHDRGQSIETSLKIIACWRELHLIMITGEKLGFMMS